VKPHNPKKNASIKIAYLATFTRNLNYCLYSHFQQALLENPLHYHGNLLQISKTKISELFHMNLTKILHCKINRKKDITSWKIQLLATSQ
jgi:hypothetical protein